jgi:LuxR family glucitol operon transcriptional activator
MSFSASRLTLYAILSAIEEDLRTALRLYFSASISVDDFFGEELYKKCKDRYEREDGPSEERPQIHELVVYTDFSEAFQLLNTHSAYLPVNVATYIKSITPDLAKLVPIRNRVMHSRPLNYDDLALCLDTCEKLVLSSDFQWSDLSTTLSRLKMEPSYVLGLQIPVYDIDNNHKHNLPTPDFDETGFIGRKQQVAQVINLCLGPYPVITLVGDGGIGKTALALKVAYDILDRVDCPYDAIVWTSSKTTQLTVHEIRRIEGSVRNSLGMLQNVAHHLAGIDVEDPLDEVLSYLSEFKILLILDNLETVLDHRIRDFLGRLPMGSKILITSRIGLGAYDYPVKLQAMEESSQLLRALARSRSVSELVRTSNGQLNGYCKRMKDNPGYIKWFVSAVQAGMRPEEVLGNPSMFLDFCMSNVYDYLSSDSRKILQSLLCLPGKKSQAELSFINQFPALELQKSIQELLTTNMVIMTSIPKGASFESHYDISDLARQYLSRHHPSTPDEFSAVKRKWQQMIAAGEQIVADQTSNAYSPYSICMRSKSDRLVAKYLWDALNETKRSNFDRVQEAITNARALAPEYFEVHRVEAWAKVKQRDISGAAASYEAAVELESDYAPLQFWYGTFLLRYMDDLEESLLHLQKACQLDPKAFDPQIEVVRVLLYRKDFVEVKKCIDNLLLQGDASVLNSRKVYDLKLQYFQRLADHFVTQQDYLAALKSLGDLKTAYEQCPIGLLDAEMREKLDKAVPTARACARNIFEDMLKQEASEMVEWLSWAERASDRRSVNYPS